MSILKYQFRFLKPGFIVCGLVAPGGFDGTARLLEVTFASVALAA